MLCTDVSSNRLKYNYTWMANLHGLNLTQEDLQYLINITSLVPDDGSPNHHHQTDAGCYNCGGAVKSYSLLFREVHGYVSLFLCLFGALANALNIAVLTRKDLAGSPINRILCGLALADLALMVEYTPFTCYMYLTTAKKEEFSHVGAVYVLLHTYVSQVLHTTSIALTLVLAMWRYVVVKLPNSMHTICSDRRCTIAIKLSYLLPFIICSPTFLVFEILETKVVENGTVATLYHLGLSTIARVNHELLYMIHLWTYAVIIKLLPCLILTVVTISLINALSEASERKAKRLPTQQQMARIRNMKLKKRMDRTSRIMIAVLLLFLATEFPQGILGLLSGILGRGFFRTCYNLFGELMDMLALLNASLNFVFYCCMSKQFRVAFGQLFKTQPSIMFKPSNILETFV
ncbi:sex peptide receptor-like [Rhopalosiphum maidis]|uniref:sex peptide receptor-like n=1 Tax=Rhopalosiphum maidis TaxID=43146 RepID=UPI000F009C4C|nr:sex peptide receptor-like [Rhopalosiphum maidis]XP_026813222.1 sex peptide receptor-like [Rhopalosiphum maidis]